MDLTDSFRLRNTSNILPEIRAADSEFNKLRAELFEKEWDCVKDVIEVRIYEKKWIEKKITPHFKNKTKTTSNPNKVVYPQLKPESRYIHSRLR